MASGAQNDYERRRLENIRRNSEMMASLLLQRKAADLSASLKRPSSKTPKPSPDRKKSRPSPQPPIVIRRSLRTRGLPPDQSPHPEPSDVAPSPPASDVAAARRGPLLAREVFFQGPGSSDLGFKDVILGASGRPSSDLGKEGGPFDPRSSLVLRPENVGKVLSERILTVKFFPFGDRTVIAVGNKLGHVGFWDVDYGEGDGDGVYVYAPHSAPVSGISIHPFSPTKVFTCGYDGFIRLMDIGKETFNMIYSSDAPIYSICPQPNDNNYLYLGEGSGELKMWDQRVGKVSSSWDLHEQRINTIDFHPENSNLVATSSTDGMACIWDLRSIKNDRPESLKNVQHRRAVHSAYFSPSGSFLATTSIDDSVGILGGNNFDDLTLIRHNNQTGRWLSSFRAIWGWDDSYLFLGNMRRAVDVISIKEKTTTPLESEHMTSIPCRFAAHSCKRGSLACATAGGKIYLWTGS
ncbi:WD repeat-containing protein 76 [Phoenix dactylifera]|uniref:WD repeat-containing protein 76 n=1 Tax=Phoenix dactylifera TaxID=42345 RepID=A0A8B7MSN0_PHODC|nr:WD repeat-containing protein 76 [Phoenix dactylifera]